MPGLSLISLISTIFWRLRCSDDFFCSRKRNLPKSRILQTGGVALGTISTRSRPASSARRRRLRDVDGADVLSLGVDELDLQGANVAIDARPAFLRRRGRLHGTTNGHSPGLVDAMG